MVIAPSKKNTISLTSADAWDNSFTAISVEGAYKQNKVNEYTTLKRMMEHNNHSIMGKKNN